MRNDVKKKKNFYQTLGPLEHSLVYVISTIIRRGVLRPKFFSLKKSSGTTDKEIKYQGNFSDLVRKIVDHYFIMKLYPYLKEKE